MLKDKILQYVTTRAVVEADPVNLVDALYQLNYNFGNYNEMGIFNAIDQIRAEAREEYKHTNIRQWYMENYPTDELGPEINEDVTFEAVYKAMEEGIDFYDLMGAACDTTIRERIFTRMAFTYDVEYGDIYDMWLKD